MSSQTSEAPVKPEPEVVDNHGNLLITLEGVAYVLRPSYQAITSIERMSGQTLFDLAGKSARSCLSLDELALIVTEMFHAYGKTLSNDDPLAATYRSCKAEDIGKLIFPDIVRINGRICIVLMGCLTGGYNPEGEPIAARS